MQKERHSSRECSGGNDETETKHGEESTTSVMQMSTESGSDYHSSNEKKPFADKFCQSLAPPPVTVGNAIATEGEDSDDSDDSDEASHSHKLKTAAQLLSPREQSLRGTQNRIIPLSPPSQQQQLQQHMHNHHHDDTLERGCCCFVNSENDWNARYQQILLLPKTTDREKLRRAVELKKLYDEFDESAIRIAKELVTENGSPIKKYPPVSTNGVAGGQSKKK